MGRAGEDLVRGVTLIELLMVIAILAIAGVLATPIIFSSYRSYETSNIQMRLQNHLHLAMREIAKDIEYSIPIPGSISGRAFDIISPTEIRVYNFNWPNGQLVQAAHLQNSLNYSTTTITYADGQITSTRTGGNLPDLTRTLGVPEKKGVGTAQPIRFSKLEFLEGPDTNVKNTVAVTLTAEAITRYGKVDALLTTVVAARGRRAGD